MAKQLVVLIACLMAATACSASVQDVAREERATADVDVTSRSTDTTDTTDTTDDAEDEQQRGLLEDPDSIEGEDIDDGDVATAAEEFSVLASLGQIPESATRDITPLQVSVGDVNAAADQARVRRPLDSADIDDLVEFVGPLTGFSPDDQPLRVFVPFPARLRDMAISRLDEFIEEVGFSPADVTSFAALESPPSEFLVLGGVTVTPGLPEIVPGVATIGDAEDYEFSIESRSAARPLGRALRVGQQDGQVAIGLDTQAVADWVEGSGPTLADNDGLRALATRLDEEQVVSALLVTQGLTYRAVGLGWRADNRGPRGVIVLSYENEAAATTALDGVASSLVGESTVTGLSVTELIVVELIEVRGAEIVATVEFVDDRPPQIILTMLLRGDGPF